MLLSFPRFPVGQLRTNCFTTTSGSLDNYRNAQTLFSYISSLSDFWAAENEKHFFLGLPGLQFCFGHHETFSFNGFALPEILDFQHENAPQNLLLSDALDLLVFGKIMFAQTFDQVFQVFQVLDNYKHTLRPLRLTDFHYFQILGNYDNDQIIC